jgi:O-antigen/teichoic acid export membrane protein
MAQAFATVAQSTPTYCQRFVPVAGNQLAALALGVAGIKLMSHVALPEIYGGYILFLTLAQLGMMLTHAGVINHTSRYWQREMPQWGSYARFLFRSSLEAAPVLALLCLAGALALSLGTFSWAWIFALLFAANLGQVWFSISNMALNAQGRLWTMCGLGVAANATRVLFPPLLAMGLGASLLTLGSGYLLHVLVVTGILLLIFRGAWGEPGAPGALREKWREELRAFGRPFVLLGAGGWLLQNADRWVIAFFFGKEAAGIFGMALSIAGIVPVMIAAGLLQVFFPEIFRQADAAVSREDWRRLAVRTDRLTLVFLAGGVGSAALIWLVGPWFVGTLVSENYAATMPLLFVAGMSVISTQANQFHFLLLQGQHNSRAMVKVMLVVALVKTAGTLIAAAISWMALLIWLAASLIVVALLGRALIHRLALAAMPVSNETINHQGNAPARFENF